MRRSEHAPVVLRLAFAFVLTAVLAVAIVTGLAIGLGGRDINSMVQERREDLTRSLRANAAATYNTGTPGWSDVDLRPALDLAARSGTTFAVLDANGRIVASTIREPSAIASGRRSPITVGNQRIGTLVVSYTDRGLVNSAEKLRSSLTKAVIGAAAIAALLAVVAALLVARRLTKPVVRLIQATRRMSEGDRNVRVGRLAGAPKELEELASSFDGMARALSDQDRLRRNLVSDVAHELRTPVAILQANCEALLDGVVPHTPTQTASLHEEVLRLAGLVDDLQSLAGADAASLHLSLAPCDLAVIADVAVDAMAARFKAAGLTVVRHLQPVLIDGDPVRLHQAITNVLTNAQKFTPPGGQVSVELTSGAGRARLVVTDTGPGISREEQPRIFERFWRGESAGRTSGSGIGLAVVAQLVEAHGGSVEVDSSPGSGTSMVLSFSLAGGVPA